MRPDIETCSDIETLRREAFRLTRVIEALVDQDNSRIEVLKKALEKAANTFRKYEQLHKDKNTEDALIKAKDNSLLAEIMEQAIKGVK